MSSNQPPKPWKVLLAVDGSSHCLAAAALLHDLPWPAGSEATLLAVLPPQPTPKRQALLETLDVIRELAQSGRLMVHLELLEGHPAEQLVAFAETLQPDLLMVGAKGLRATLGILLGGVAQQLVEYARCPVLVVRGTPERPQLQRVLVAIDSSHNAERVVDYMGSLPLPAEACLSVMHVLPPLTVPNNPPPTWLLGRPPELPQLYPDTEVALASAKIEEAEGQARLAQAATALAGRSVNTILARGDAATEILERAREGRADLIVAGSRGLSAVRGLWFGSVSRKLVHYAACSVLIVKDCPD